MAIVKGLDEWRGLEESTMRINNMNKDGMERNGDGREEKKIMIYRSGLMAKKEIILKSNKMKCITSKQEGDRHESY